MFGPISFILVIVLGLISLVVKRLMSDLKDQRRELLTTIRRLKALPRSEEVAQERARCSEALRECESKMLIEKATRWGIEVPDNKEWYAVESGSRAQDFFIILPYLNQTGTAILRHRIRKARMAYWKGCAEILITVLSLIVAILALLLKR